MGAGTDRAEGLGQGDHGQVCRAQAAVAVQLAPLAAIVSAVCVPRVGCVKTICIESVCESERE